MEIKISTIPLQLKKSQHQGLLKNIPLNSSDYDYELDEKNCILSLQEVILLQTTNLCRIALRMRSFLFKTQRITQKQDQRTRFSSFSYPFNNYSLAKLKVNIISLLNGVGGGVVYIGIKSFQSQNKNEQKQAFVYPNRYVISQMQEIKQLILKIQKQIFADKNDELPLVAEFVPVRQFPFQNVPFNQQMGTYNCDFNNINLHKYPFRQGQYVLRIRVPQGCPDQIYQCSQEQYNTLNQKKLENSNNRITRKCYIPLRKGNRNVMIHDQEEFFKTKAQLIENCKQQIYQKEFVKPQVGKPTHLPQNSKMIEEIVQKALLLQKQQLKQQQLKQKKKQMRQLYQFKNQKSWWIPQITDDISQANQRFVVIGQSQSSIRKLFYGLDHIEFDWWTNTITHQNMLTVQVANQYMKGFQRITKIIKLSSSVIFYPISCRYYTSEQKRAINIQINRLRI